MDTLIFRHPHRLLGQALLISILCAGCASTPRPDSQLAAGNSAINDALTAGASALAPLELQNARDKLARANAAVAAEDYDSARRLAEEAEVDARLAAAKASSARATQAVAQVQKGINTLKNNLNAPLDTPAGSTPNSTINTPNNGRPQ